MGRPIVQIEFPDQMPLEELGNHQRVVTESVPVWLEFWDGQRLKLADIEAGFITDGASRPWFAKWWLKHWGPEADAAVLHDWFLHLLKQGVIDRPKFLIDLLFMAALVATRVSFFRATIMFLSVRTRG
jgi:hypothetical protein